MKVSILIPTLHGGGAERVASILATELADDFDIEIVLFRRRIDYPTEVPIIDLDLTLPGGISDIFNGIGPFRAYQERRRPDCVISFMFEANVLNLLTSEHRKAVLSVRTPLSYALPTNWRGRVVRATVGSGYPQADRIVPLCKGVGLDLTRRFDVDSSLIQPIYNPIDVAHVEAQAQEGLSPGFECLFEHDVLINVARMVADKGQWSLIRAFSMARPRQPSTKLIILGDGPLRPYLLECASACGLRTWQKGDSHSLADSDVIMPGHVKNPHAWVSRSKLFVLSSVREGFGNVLVEAMAAGCPIVAGDCPFGPGEIIRADGYHAGLLLPTFPERIPPADLPVTSLESDWAEALDDLLNDESKRVAFQQAGKRRVQDFALAKIAGEWRALLHALE